MAPMSGNTQGYVKAFDEAGRDVLTRFTEHKDPQGDILMALAKSVLAVEKAFLEYVPSHAHHHIT